MLRPVPPSEGQGAREAVSAKLDGELTELGTARLSAHLRECDACTAFALELGALATRLRTAPLELPQARVALPARRRRPAPQLAAAAAVAGIAAVSSLALGPALRSSGGPAPAPPPAVTFPRLPQGIRNPPTL